MTLYSFYGVGVSFVTIGRSHFQVSNSGRHTRDVHTLYVLRVFSATPTRVVRGTGVCFGVFLGHNVGLQVARGGEAITTRNMGLTFKTYGLYTRHSVCLVTRVKVTMFRVVDTPIFQPRGPLRVTQRETYQTRNGVVVDRGFVCCSRNGDLVWSTQGLD